MELDLEVCRSIAVRNGLPLQFVFKEFHIINIIGEIAGAAFSSKNPLVLKGGTALNKVYLKKLQRFSEDIDFDLVIKNADQKNLVGLGQAINDLAARARNKKLMPDEVTGGTFTVTNPGSFGNLYGFPIINQPQVAILGVGAIKKRPVVIDDAIAIRSMVYISMSYDHRIIDGALGGMFMQKVVYYLENFDVHQSL